jgi:hypothetical protein
MLSLSPLPVIARWLQLFYRACARELRRLEAQGLSPLYSLFGETLSGAPTLRAAAAQRHFMKVRVCYSVMEVCSCCRCGARFLTTMMSAPTPLAAAAPRCRCEVFVQCCGSATVQFVLRNIDWGTNASCSSSSAALQEGENLYCGVAVCSCCPRGALLVNIAVCINAAYTAAPRCEGRVLYSVVSVCSCWHCTLCLAKH